MCVDIVFEDNRWLTLGLQQLAGRATKETLEHVGLDADTFEITLLACDDFRIAELNGAFRDKPAPTNVLSWPSEERASKKDGEAPALPETVDTGEQNELGDIAISWGTCQREAVDSQKSMADHTVHLTVHGILHLLGYDHSRDKDATLMEQLETEILGKLGIADPYCV